ncbi:hypothetical protein HPB52_003626 [Rhipicephalus sanguineus]|uniref:CCHC-type domain-containing protein n=1 Tax=Rhipicephalus sanguineus TaxID=34632 RepID=A0A9D4PC00_RHISA|nr:hypothetical protein HPB52_003626 [Rhipicephalus sanguineus]
MAAVHSNLPVRENSFFFNAPDGDVSIDDLIDAIEITAGEDSVHVLQHMGGSRFLVCTRNAAQATKLMVAEGFMLRNERVAVEAVGPPITFVNVFRYPAYLPDDPLTNALAQFGKVKSVAFATYNRQNKLNGVRVVRMEMSKPVPNFTTVAGHRVMFEYRGMRRVCARCSEVGHMASACTTPYCKRCGTFGHDTEGCEAECKRCGGKHGTRDCFRKRSYVAAARGLLTAHETASNQDRASVLNFSDGRSERSSLQVLHPRTPARTPSNAPTHRDTTHTVTSDTTNTEPSTLSIPAAQPVNAEDTGSADTRGDLALGSGSESSSPDSSRDSWVVVSSGPEDQASLPKGEETTDNEGHGAPEVTDESFPPLHAGNTRPPSFDDIPIKSCGRYIPPVDKARGTPAALPGPSRQSPPTSKAEVAPAPGKTHPPGQEQRHRSRSRQRSADGTEDRTAGKAANAETAPRRSGPPGGSSDSDAPARNQPKRPRKGSVGDGAPQPSDDVA